MAHESALTPPQALAALIDAGLTLSMALTVFAARQSEEDKAFIQRARERHHVDGEVEIDDNALVSGSEDDGDYVLAWVWVSQPEPTTEDADEG